MNRILATTASAVCLWLSAWPLFAQDAAMRANGGANGPDRLMGLVAPMKATKSFKLGVAVVHLMDNFYTGIAYGIADEAKRAGVDVVQVSVAGGYGNVQQQFAQLQAFKTLGVDYAVLSPAAYAGYDNVIKSLQSSGIKTISVGIPTESSHIAFGILQSDTEIGQKLGQALCKDGGAGKRVLVIPGAPGLEWSRLRVVGFEEAAKACGAILGPIAYKGEMTLQDGLAQTSDQLLRDPKVSYIFTPVSYLGMGAVQGSRQLGRKIPVLTSTMVKEEEGMIKDGRMLAVASEPGIIMGRLVVQYAIRDHEGLPMPPLSAATKSVPYSHRDVPIDVVTKANVASHPFNEAEYPPKDWKVGR